MSKRYYGGFISGTQNINGRGMQSVSTSYIPIPVIPTTIMSATGGTTITTSGNYKIHTFTSSGTFTVTAGVRTAIEYLIIAGGGAGGGTGTAGTNGHYGGGGAGGFLESYSGQILGQDFAGAKIYVDANDVLTVTVGAGGQVSLTGGRGGNGSNSSIVKSGSYSVVSVGGGGGGSTSSNGSANVPGSGGSSGGNGYSAGWIGVPGEAVTSPRQGYRAVTGVTSLMVAGGGAGGTGDSNVPPSFAAPGRASSITGASVTYSAGNLNSTTSTPITGAANTGNGGGGGSQSSGVSGAGGSGIVIIRYLFQ